MPPRCHTANKALKPAFGLVIYEERRAGIPSFGGGNDAFSAHRPKNPSLTCCEIGKVIEDVEALFLDLGLQHLFFANLGE